MADAPSAVFGSDQRVDIDLDWRGAGTVAVNGSDIGRAVREVTVHARAGFRTEVTLDLTVFDSTRVNADHAEVSMSTGTRDLLLAAGWIPPAGTPAPGDLAAAIDTIVRAWAPRRLPTGTGDNPDPWDGDNCQCAGDDDNLEPLGCNCADNCTCGSCQHANHAETRRCRLVVPREGQPHAWCGRETEYQIRGFCVHRDGVHRMASDGDPMSTSGSVRLGDSIQKHAPMYACSTQHARELIEQDRQYRERFPADSALAPSHTFYDVEPYTYRPDDTDVPGPLHPLESHLSSARYWTESAIRETHLRRPALDYTVHAFLEHLAAAVQNAGAYLDERARGAVEEAADLAVEAARE